MSQSERLSDVANPYAPPELPPLAATEPTDEDSARRQLRAFVGAKAQYYLDKWTPLLRDLSGSAGFNWAAFLLSGLWLPYRKMYKATLIFYAIIILESVAEEVVFVGVLDKPETPPALSRIVGLVAALICGAYGNRWYLSHAHAMVSKLSREGLRDETLLQVLSRRGGTSVAASLGMFVLFMAVLIAVFIPLELLLYEA